jgi:hypothetical protein
VSAPGVFRYGELHQMNPRAILQLVNAARLLAADAV